MRKTYKFRLYHSNKETEILNNVIENCRKFYNSQLEYEEYIYVKEKRFVDV